MKLCKKCGEEKALDCFRIRKGRTNPDPTCTSCQKEANLDRYHNRPETTNAHWRSHVRYSLKKYGMTPESYQELYDSAGGSCQCCRKPVTSLLVKVPGQGSKGDRGVIDHCHVTGAVRGLLCSTCNSGIGLLGDNLESVLSAVEYLGGKR